MNGRTRKIIIFSTLPIALIWAYFTLSAKKTVVTPASDPALTTVAPLSAPAQPAQIADTALISRIKSQSWGSDPFRGRTVYHASETKSAPVAVKSDNQLSFVLSGIMFSAQNPVAYLNGRAVTVGQKVNSATVVSIERRAVILELGGRRFTISLSKDTRS